MDRVSLFEFSHPVRGRDVELSALHDFLERVVSGQGPVVVLEGGAGMGKSRLVAEVAAMAECRSIRVGSGVGAPGSSVVQMAGLMEALFDGRAPILDRAALHDARVTGEQRYWLLRELQTMLEQAADNGPLLVCLDDMQWADSGTAAALRTLPLRIGSARVGWVVAVRPDQGSGELRGALDHLARSGAERITLGPLDKAAVASVAGDILSAEPDRALLDSLEPAGGSPFFLVELLSGLHEEGLVRIESGRAQLLDARLPSRVSESMRRRLEKMSGPARQTAVVASSLGRRFSLNDLAAMLDVAPSTLIAPVEELVHCGVLIDRDDRLNFRHDLTLDAVRGSVPLAVRRALDRQAAEVLLSRGALPVEVATQIAASAEPGDEVAIVTLLRAAEALGNTDPGAAADLSQRALELAPAKHALRGPLVAHTAIWLHAAARGDEAKAFADTALRGVLPPEQEAEVRLSIGGMFALSPDVRAEASRPALALADIPAGLRARHLAFLFHNLVNAGRPDEARTVLQDARSAVDRYDGPAGQFVLELAQSGLAYADGCFGRALELVESALRTSFRVSDESRVHLSLQWRCDVLAMLDRLDESLDLSREHIASAQRDRQGWALNMFEIGRGRQLLQVGRLNEAGAALDGHFSPDVAHQIVSVLDAAGVVAFGRVALHTGDQSNARSAAQVAHVMLSQSAPSVRRHGAWLRALQTLADGDALAAHQWLCALGQEERLSIVPVFPMDVTDAARLAHIAVAVQDHELATKATEVAQRHLSQNPRIRSIAAVAAHVDGILNHNRENLAKAVRLFECGHRPLALAAALEDLGIANVDAGLRHEAVDAFGRALELSATASATRDVNRLRGRLRALGVRRRLVSVPRPATGWAAMTRAELAVARLVAEGFTNREVAEHLFVSPYTVSGHLRHVFAKLEVNSRVELARLAGTEDARV